MSSRHYYNELDPYCVRWLSNLIAANLIPPGDVDPRDIRAVQPSDLKGYVQCHFFAGIAGWPLALKLSGWSDDRPIWTGSCPCQPFSLAGSRQGFLDERHLWPVFHRLISISRPATILGEQVASAFAWLNLVRNDLETLGYAVGALPIEAASAGAEHFRDRYWFVADLDEQFPGTQRLQRSGELGRASLPSQNHSRPLVDASLVGWGEGWAEHELWSRRFAATVASIDGRQYVECSDGKWRRLPPPRVRWLGNGIPSRVAKLRALGNAIDPRPASEFISAFMEHRP